MDRSRELFARAKEVIPGGVNSPVRAFRAVGAEPVFIQSGRGSRLVDADGREYIDYVCSWGPLILGHRPQPVVEAVRRVLAEVGTSFGAPTELEVLLAGEIIAAVPSVEMVRLVNSGTEATMSALRLARAYTGRDKIVKFAGCYHGHADYLLVEAGSGALTLGVPSSPGVPAAFARETLTAQYNDLDSVEALFRQYPEEIAAVIVEPVAGNMGCIPPASGFLPGLRRLTQEYGSLLIFDEVITGFRVARGGAQERYGVLPDLTCLGKIIGGGLPVGAYGGRKDIMEMVAPAGPVYQAGTLSGNPLAVAAGLATLEELRRPDTYDKLETLGERMEQGISQALARNNIPGTVNRVGSLFTLFFHAGPVGDYAAATASDTNRFAAFFRGLLNWGIYWPPSQFESVFISLAHTPEDIDRTVAAVEKSLA
ncbi:MAG: glutamate-1-semialdehyde-2,1-aminomutase [Clostridia bacterium]|nr:MAG: glutamate-1-semialdehyde-2,1-aminomutase [Clostridia bacterium]